MSTSIEPDPLALERQVCFAVSAAQRSILALYRPLLEPMGLTHPQYLVLLALWQQSPLSVKRLSELLQLDSATLSPLLKRLDTNGLVTRTRSSTDERLLLIELTPAGRALRAQAEQIPPTILARLGMTLAELEGLHAGLTKLNAAALQAATAPIVQ